MLLVWIFSGCFIYISYLGYYIYIGLIDWLDSRSLISGCPQFHSGWLPYTPHAMISGWPSIPRYSATKQNGYYLCANICGCRKTGWRNPTGFLNSYLYCNLCIVIYKCDVYNLLWLRVVGRYSSLLGDVLKTIRNTRVW